MYVWQINFIRKAQETAFVIAMEDTLSSAMEALKSTGPYADCVILLSAVSYGQLWNEEQLRWRDACNTKGTQCCTVSSREGWALHSTGQAVAQQQAVQGCTGEVLGEPR